MPKRYEQEEEQKEKALVVPNFGFIRVLDRDLQKQLEDLNEMEGLDTDNKEARKIIGKPK